MKTMLCLCLFLTTLCFGYENLELLIAPEVIEEQIALTAAEINAEYKDKNLTVVAVMKGAICIASDLIRHLKVPFTFEYIKASSYGMNGDKPGELIIKGLETADLSKKDVLVVDDILDTGKTMAAILKRLQEKNPKSLKSLVLLQKKVPRESSFCCDYTLFEIEDRFVVGYGMDYMEYYRGLPGIYAFINDQPPREVH